MKVLNLSLEIPNFEDELNLNIKLSIKNGEVVVINSTTPSVDKKEEVAVKKRATVKSKSANSNNFMDSAEF